MTPEWWNELTESLQGKILKAIQAGDIWLNKVKYNQRGDRIYGNVCLEIYLPSRGTCLLQHVNLGACHVEDLRPAYRRYASTGRSHGRTGVGDTGEYLSPELTDKWAWAFSDWLTSSGFTESLMQRSEKPLGSLMKDGMKSTLLQSF